MRLLVALLVAGTAALVFAGGGDGAQRVGVVLDEGRIAPERASVTAGKVSFDVRNAGRTEHELIVIRTGLAPDRLPMGLEGPAVKLAGRVVLGTPHVHRAHEPLAGSRLGASRHLQPGDSRRETVRLDPGRYVLLCTLPGHYESGQRAALTAD